MIVFCRAFDGTAFSKSREYLRALLEMRIAGRRTGRFADFGSLHPWDGGAATQNQGDRYG
jgi:hypothetical protein